MVTIQRGMLNIIATLVQISSSTKRQIHFLMMTCHARLSSLRRPTRWAKNILNSRDMKAKYRERRTYEKFDNEHYAVFLNEKETMVPVTTGMGNEEQEVEQVPGYEYEGSQQDGSTLIVAENADRDSLINGIIRSRYSQTSEDAVKTHRLQLIGGEITEDDKKAEYDAEWSAFNDFRELAINTVDSWLTAEV